MTCRKLPNRQPCESSAQPCCLSGHTLPGSIQRFQSVSRNLLPNVGSVHRDWTGDQPLANFLPALEVSVVHPFDRQPAVIESLAQKIHPSHPLRPVLETELHQRANLLVVEQSRKQDLW